ncbi:uncharacterized protein STEHIDRAFT_138149 [Stereum hirsutum FP-91666 SS1]|uniref:uncharacterized protein n=1 Tax=Stereum hirsutum (strain FP-91666) TaxID=721885 RepID=UPI000440E6EC|nr:uncharacterized protein STEHIDRAFT_138149 [Stereum hirsutum FP-91666 SS1]EIM89056.1 hypothetical protein STEHIDRAFT_138149 [Stereum hirsutum FP-91666 SS1]
MSMMEPTWSQHICEYGLQPVERQSKRRDAAPVRRTMNSGLCRGIAHLRVQSMSTEVRAATFKLTITATMQAVPVPQLPISKNEEVVLVNALITGRLQGLSDRQVIQSSLHMTNNRPAEQWATHFHQNHARLDAEVSQWSKNLPNGPARSTKARRSSTPYSRTMPPPPLSRRTRTPTPIFRPISTRSLDRQTEPEASPAPSTILEESAPSRSRAKEIYTDQDSQYMLECFALELQRNPRRTLNQICERLAVDHWAAESIKVNQLLERERKKALQHRGDLEPDDSVRGGSEDEEDNSE